MNTTELTSFVRNEADLLDYPRYNKDGDGEYIHFSAINHVLDLIYHCCRTA